MDILESKTRSHISKGDNDDEIIHFCFSKGDTVQLTVIKFIDIVQHLTLMKAQLIS